MKDCYITFEINIWNKILNSYSISIIRFKIENLNLKKRKNKKLQRPFFFYEFFIPYILRTNLISRSELFSNSYTWSSMV